MLKPTALGKKSDLVIDDETAQHEILNYWLGEDQTPLGIEKKEGMWYSGGDDLDRHIKSTFGDILAAAANEEIVHWAQSAHGSLALIIVLDQFSRHIHRGTKKAFAQDALARALSKRALTRGLQTKLSVAGQLFLLHPLHHSEELQDQDEVVERVLRLMRESGEEWAPYLKGCLDFFHGHREIVKRFGRFPHRNDVLGRESSEEELEFLKENSRFGQ